MGEMTDQVFEGLTLRWIKSNDPNVRRKVLDRLANAWLDADQIAALDRMLMVEDNITNARGSRFDCFQ
jgi:hypothetical protein